MLGAATPSAPAHPHERLDLSDLARQARTEEPVTYTAVLPVPRPVVHRVADLLGAHVQQLMTRPGRRALSAWDQAVAFLRVMLHDVEPDQIALDCAIGRSTAHRPPADGRSRECPRRPSTDAVGGIDRRPHRRTPPDTAGHRRTPPDTAGHRRTPPDTAASTSTEPSSTPTGSASLAPPPGRTPRAPAPSGSRSTSGGPASTSASRSSGGNIQVVTAPDGWPLWVSDVRPGREHDVTAARTDPERSAQVDRWRDDGRTVLADLGYEGEAERMLTPVKADVNGKDRR